MTNNLSQQTYKLLKTVPAGHVTTYKDLAQKLNTKAYRAIGQILRCNPYAFTACPERSRRVPCHRVVRSDGTIGGFIGETSGTAIKKKIELLKQEGIIILNNRIINFSKVLYRFK